MSQHWLLSTRAYLQSLRVLDTGTTFQHACDRYSAPIGMKTKALGGSILNSAFFWDLLSAQQGSGVPSAQSQSPEVAPLHGAFNSEQDFGQGEWEDDDWARGAPSLHQGGGWSIREQAFDKTRGLSNVWGEGFDEDLGETPHPALTTGDSEDHSWIFAHPQTVSPIRFNPRGFVSAPSISPQRALAPPVSEPATLSPVKLLFKDVAGIDEIEFLDRLAVFHRFAFANRSYAIHISQTHIASAGEVRTNVELQKGVKKAGEVHTNAVSPKSTNKIASVRADHHRFGALIPIPGVQHLTVVSYPYFQIAEFEADVKIQPEITQSVTAVLQSANPFYNDKVSITFAELKFKEKPPLAFSIKPNKSKKLAPSVLVRVAKDSTLVCRVQSKDIRPTVLSLNHFAGVHALSAATQVMGSEHAVLDLLLTDPNQRPTLPTENTVQIMFAQAVQHNHENGLDSSSNAVARLTDPLVALSPALPITYLLHLAFIVNAKYLKIVLGGTTQTLKVFEQGASLVRYSSHLSPKWKKVWDSIGETVIPNLAMTVTLTNEGCEPECAFPNLHGISDVKTERFSGTAAPSVWAPKTRVLPLNTGSPINGRLLQLLPLGAELWITIVKDSANGIPGNREVVVKRASAYYRFTAHNTSQFVVLTEDRTAVEDFPYLGFTRSATYLHTNDKGRSLHCKLKTIIAVRKTEKPAGRQNEALNQATECVISLETEPSSARKKNSAISAISTAIANAHRDSATTNPTKNLTKLAMLCECLNSILPNTTIDQMNMAEYDTDVDPIQSTRNEGPNMNTWKHEDCSCNYEKAVVPLTAVYGVYATKYEADSALASILTTNSTFEVTAPFDCCTMGRDTETVFIDPVAAVKHMCEVGAAPGVVQITDATEMATLVGFGLGSMRLVASLPVAPHIALLPVFGFPRASALEFSAPGGTSAGAGAGAGAGADGGGGSSSAPLATLKDFERELQAAVCDVAGNRIPEMLDPAARNAYNSYALAERNGVVEDICHGTTLARFANGGCKAPAQFVPTDQGTTIMTMRILAKGEPLEVSYAADGTAPWLRDQSLCLCASCLEATVRFVE